MIAAACQPFGLSRGAVFREDIKLTGTLASPHLLDSSTSLLDLVRKSQITKARLLHYFPPGPNDTASTENEPIDSWCGFHLDHSLLTGLCPVSRLKQTFITL